MIEITEDKQDTIRLLRAYPGEPGDFWKEYLELLVRLAKADWAVLFSQESGPADTAGWKAVTSHPPDRSLSPAATALAARVAAAAAKSRSMACESQAAEGLPTTTVAGTAVGVGDRLPAAVCLGWGRADAFGESERLAVRLLSDIPQNYLDRRALESARDEAKSYRGVLEAVSAVYEQAHFLPAAMTLCNELAARLECDQVSLGLLRNNRYVELQAISGTSQFDKKAAAVKSLEHLMEEALDQDDDIVFPVPEGFSVVAREHEHYAASQGAKHLATVLLRREDRSLGAVCCQRSRAAFRDGDIRQASLVGEMCADRLVDLDLRRHWFGHRVFGGLRQSAGRLLGPEYTWAKLSGVVLAVLLMVLLFGRATYRVRAPFTLKTDSLSAMSVPYDGTVDSVSFDIGDEVPEGKALLSLDTKPLRLEAVSMSSDLQRYTREAEKHRAENRLADMRIAEALARQTQARLDLLNYRIERSLVRAPIAGVVVEGRWKDRIHAPVREGELVARIAKLDKMFVEVEVGVEDIANVAVRARGEVVYISNPKIRFPVSVVRVDPAATQERSGPVFIVRAEYEGAVPDWWRPGMTGVARIDAGRRSLWWIVTHRTGDFLRRVLWW